MQNYKVIMGWKRTLCWIFIE